MTKTLLNRNKEYLCRLCIKLTITSTILHFIAVMWLVHVKIVHAQYQAVVWILIDSNKDSKVKLDDGQYWLQSYISQGI